ncbi:MAG: methyltransferase domain-containing protein [Desertimonas sp.]
MAVTAPDARIAAIVWTYGRPDVAAAAVAAIGAQTLRVERIVVVDSATPDGGGDALASRLGDRAEVIVLDDNLGPGGAITAGLARLDLADLDAVWFVEDDSRPDRHALAALVAARSTRPGPRMVGPDAADMRRGQWRLRPRHREGVSEPADLVYLDGALVDADAVASVGPPRADLFLMHVDVDYPMRLADAGVSMLQHGIGYETLRLGASSGSNHWRSYYQTRNHLRLALDRRSPVLLAGFATRTARQLAVAVLAGEIDVVGLRMRGIVDAARRRMGRTLEPAPPGPTDPYDPPIDDPITAELLGHTYTADFERDLGAFLSTRGGTRRWSTLHGNGPRSRMAGFERATLAELEHHTGPLTGKRVLDFGCGSGTILPSIARRAAAAAGFDISAEAVAITRARLAEHGLGSVPVHRSDSYREIATDLGSFDLVILHAVFEHVPLSIGGRRRDVLRLAFDAVRPGGHLVISESPNRLWPRDIYCTGLWGLPWTRGGSRWAYRRAVRAGRHDDPDQRGPISLEERGAWGFTYWAVRRYLSGRRYVVVNSLPGHDRWVRYHRTLGGRRRGFETIIHHLVTRTLGGPVVAFAPMLSPLVIQRIDGDDDR